MASGRFTDVPARPTAFLDFGSVTLGESGEFPTRVKGVVTLLGKSRRPISHAMGVYVTREMFAVSVPFKRHMHARISARF